MSLPDSASLMVQMALRSLWAHKIKSALVGGILFFGTALMVTGNSVLSSIEAAMAGSVTQSLSGDYQIYDATAKDPLELFGGFGMGTADIGEIPDFDKVDKALGAEPGVKAVVPMGLVTATVFAPTELDTVLEALRGAVRAQDLAAANAQVPAVQRIVTTFLGEIDNRLELTSDPASVRHDKESLTTAISAAFWAPFHPAADAAPDWAAMSDALDFLDRSVAPLAADGRLFYLRTIGTDLDQFSKRFDRFYIVKGTAVPPGKRGFILSDRTYERLVKNRVAREFDDIHKQVTKNGKKIADDPLLQNQIARNARQYQRVVFEVSPSEAPVLEAKLRAFLPDAKGDFDALVQQFLTVNDENLEARYKFFYDEVAPRIRLYDIPINQVLSLRAYTKSGYMKSVNVRVYGTYEFRGLEESDLASASNLTDLITFRTLYGKMTDAQRAELSGIKAAVGVADVSRDDAEAELFGGTSTGEVIEAPAAPADAPTAAPAESSSAESAVDRVWTPEEMRGGLVLNAAILLKDPSQAAAMLPRLQKVISDNALGVQIVGWQTAAGMVGQFILVLRGLLIISFTIIFIVALIIINNAMVMTTMDRLGEIGTMRAIGAQRGVVLTLFLLETVLLGLLAGSAGALVGMGFISWLGHEGIPAVSNQLVLLFAGPRLYPSWSTGQILFALGTVVGVGVMSTLYPAWLASRVQPIVAMQGKE